MKIIILLCVSALLSACGSRLKCIDGELYFQRDGIYVQSHNKQKCVSEEYKVIQ